MKTVLIVDDEELFLSSLAEGLAAYANEFALLTAPNGERAKEILNARSIDLVVTDLKMPVLDGLQLIAYMMANHPPIPIIVMTAFGTPDIEGRVSEFDILDYVEKPIDYHGLADKIRAGLSVPARGQIEGITLFSFLQLLQMEQKTCSLKIKSGQSEGILHFAGGEMHNAMLGEIEGDEAAFRILSWDNARIEIIPAARNVRRRIERSLNNLLMHAAQLQDEGLLESEEIYPDVIDVETSLESVVETADAEIAANGDSTRLIVNLLGKMESEIAGFIGASVVDLESGMTLGVRSTRTDFDLTVASAYNSEIVKQKLKVMKALNLNSTLDDILLTLSDQIHLIKIVSPTSFIYLAADKSLTNLALVRSTVARHAGSLS